MKNFKYSEMTLPIIQEYKNKILDQQYLPNSPLDVLKSRFTAIIFLLSEDANFAIAAENFIKKTSIYQDEDLKRLKEFASQIISWDKLEVCSIYKNGSTPYIEYKLTTTTIDNIQQIHHYHASYQYAENQCCFVSQSPPLIRVIGDPILHKPGITFPEHPTIEEMALLNEQIAHAKEVLVQTSGAGIAANQCAKISSPYKFTIVGIFYDEPKHVEGVNRRYPGTQFPDAKIMVNPSIISYSEETQNFKHACLSVPCSNRCEIKSPKEIQVEYLDPTQNMKKVFLTVSGTDAIVLWHELAHIIFGKTYIDAAFASLSLIDLNHFENLIAKEQMHRTVNSSLIPDLSVSPFHFTVMINKDGNSILDQAMLIQALPHMTDQTIAGLLARCQLIKNEKISDVKVFYDFLIFDKQQNASNARDADIPNTNSLQNM